MKTFLKILAIGIILLAVPIVQYELYNRIPFLILAPSLYLCFGSCFCISRFVSELKREAQKSQSKAFTKKNIAKVLMVQRKKLTREDLMITSLYFGIGVVILIYGLR